MRITFKLDSFDFDKTHKTHQSFENIGQEMGNVITEKMRQLGCFENEHAKFGGSLEIIAIVRAPDLTKQEMVAYNKEYDYHFEVLDSERIVAVQILKSNQNPDKLTKTELTYLQEMIDSVPNKIIAANHGKTLETVKTYKKIIRSKAKCKTPEALKEYVDIQKLLV
jgi:DNA-binding CsgD family transcriptional regulator